MMGRAAMTIATGDVRPCEWSRTLRRDDGRLSRARLYTRLLDRGYNSTDQRVAPINANLSASERMTLAWPILEWLYECVGVQAL